MWWLSYMLALKLKTVLTSISTRNFYIFWILTATDIFNWHFKDEGQLDSGCNRAYWTVKSRVLFCRKLSYLCISYQTVVSTSDFLCDLLKPMLFFLRSQQNSVIFLLYNDLCLFKKQKTQYQVLTTRYSILQIICLPKNM